MTCPEIKHLKSQQVAIGPGVGGTASGLAIAPSAPLQSLRAYEIPHFEEKATCISIKAK